MIWVVTNVTDTQEELVPLLRAKQYEVEDVACVDGVVQRAMFRCPALIIIDCTLKGSLDLISAMRAEPRVATIPLIMFATADSSYRDESLARGADVFVQKGTLDWAELFPAIVSLVGPAPGADRADA